MILSRTFGTAQWIFDAVSTPKAGTNKFAQASHNTYDDPDTFDIHRNHDKSISFGQGPHYCIGVTLVRSQTEVMLRELFNRFPDLSLTGDVKYDYDHHNARRMTELTVKTNI